jgi:phosphoglycolate phosphatase-like HAD superfamily hydrolase
MTKKTIGLDFDGTLLDSRKRHKIVLNDTLKKNNISLDTSDLISFKAFGKSTKEYLIHKNISNNLVRKIIGEWIFNIELDRYLLLDTLYSDSIEFLKKERIKGKELVIITARRNKSGLYNQVRELGIDKYLDNVIIVDNDSSIAENKANEIVKNKIEMLIGDTEVDYAAASLANIKFYALNRGFRNRIFLKQIKSYFLKCLESIFGLHLISVMVKNVIT